MSGNDGFVEISTQKEAIDAWESFFGRFFSPAVPPGVDIKFNPELRQFIPRAKKDAKYKHPGFQDKETEQLPIDPDRTLHSDDFDDFLNGNTVTIPDHIILNGEGLEQVAKAIEKGDFENEALKKEDHTFYALWLFKQNRITRQQMTTLLARAQIPQEYPLVETFHIFDDRGQLTKEAEKLWLPAVEKGWYGKHPIKEQRKQLLELISTAPKSEQIFFISKDNPKIVSPRRRELGNILLTNNSWHRTKYKQEQYDLHFSFGVIEALQIVNGGINGAAASRAKLGKIGIDTVKEGVEFYYRPTAISIPGSGVEATTEGIHGFAYTPMPVATAHDVHHAKIHNTIPPEFHMALNHMNQIISRHTKQKWSKTMWELVDREFAAFYKQEINLDSPEDGAKFFMKMLRGSSIGQRFLFPHFKLSDDGFAIFWNMVNESDVWKKLYKIDIDELNYPYSEFIKGIRLFKQAIGSEQKERSELLTLKYRYFLVTSQAEFQRICELLDSLEAKSLLDKSLVFGKYTRGTNKNLTILKLENSGKKELIHESSVKKLIPRLVNMEFISKFGEKNDQAVESELQKISGAFKNTYKNSQFSKELLKDSIEKFPSITAKLDFLEACYEEIIHSKGYTRQHAIADSIFSFFKNPLTTSQRKHIVLLKETLNELVNEYQRGNNLNSEAIKTLHWYMENRGSNLSICNTNRFYLHIDSTVPSADITLSQPAKK